MFFPGPLPRSVFRWPRSPSTMKGWFLGPPRESRNANMRFRGPPFARTSRLCAPAPSRGNRPVAPRGRPGRDSASETAPGSISLVFGPIFGGLWTDSGWISAHFSCLQDRSGPPRVRGSSACSARPTENRSLRLPRAARLPRHPRIFVRVRGTVALRPTIPRADPVLCFS